MTNLKYALKISKKLLPGEMGMN